MDQFRVQVNPGEGDLTVGLVSGVQSKNPSIRNHILSLKPDKYLEIIGTHFVCGTFDVSGTVQEVESMIPDEGTMLVFKREGQPAWGGDRLLERIRKGGATVFIAADDAFHLAHGAEYLPPTGPLRSKFKYIASPLFKPESLLGRRVRLLSVGRTGVLYLGRSGQPDRKRTDIRPGQKVKFRVHAPGFEPPFEKVTSVSCVAFTPEGKMAATLQPRGVDIPGGHVQEGEGTIEEVTKREALEEAAITLRNVRTAMVIESDYYGPLPEQLTYLVTVAAEVAEVLPFAPTSDSFDRFFLHAEEFLDKYTAGDKKTMREEIERAYEITFGEREGG